MKAFLIVLAVLFFLGGLATFAGAKSAIHEIEALISVLIFVVCLVGAAIVGAVNALRSEVVSARVAIKARDNTA